MWCAIWGQGRVHHVPGEHRISRDPFPQPPIQHRPSCDTAPQSTTDIDMGDVIEACADGGFDIATTPVVAAPVPRLTSRPTYNVVVSGTSLQRQAQQLDYISWISMDLFHLQQYLLLLLRCTTGGDVHHHTSIYLRQYIPYLPHSIRKRWWCIVNGAVKTGTDTICTDRSSIMDITPV